MPLGDRRYVDGLYVRVCCTKFTAIGSTVCIYSEMLLACWRIIRTLDAVASHPRLFEVQRCKTSQFAGCFLPSRAPV